MGKPSRIELLEDMVTYHTEVINIGDILGKKHLIGLKVENLTAHLFVSLTFRKASEPKRRIEYLMEDICI